MTLDVLPTIKVMGQRSILQHNVTTMKIC